MSKVKPAKTKDTSSVTMQGYYDEIDEKRENTADEDIGFYLKQFFGARRFLTERGIYVA